MTSSSHSAIRGGAFRRFRACQSGAAAVEFIFAFPALVLLVFGIIEVAMVMFVLVLAEGGLREASRYGITGQVPASMTREEMIMQMIEDHTHGLIDLNGANLSHLVYPSFDDIGEPEPFSDDNGNGVWDSGESFTDINGNATWDSDMGAAGLGGPGDVVLYKIEFQWDFLLGVFRVFGGPDGALDLGASIAVQNEPYNPLQP